MTGTDKESKMKALEEMGIERGLSTIQNPKSSAKYLKKMKEIRQDYRDQMKSTKYWFKQEKRFEKFAKDKDVFSMTFLHEDEKDDEFKIYAMAENNGFVVVDETLTGRTSTYFFKRK